MPLQLRNAPHAAESFEHEIDVPTQVALAVQLSAYVQALPSSHAAPEFTGCAQAPAPLHKSFVHVLPSLAQGVVVPAGAWLQVFVAELHVSTVHGFESLQPASPKHSTHEPAQHNPPSPLACVHVAPSLAFV